MVTTTTDANGTTHFFRVYRGGSAIGDAMAFLPSGVALAETVPTLVYFHGHNHSANLGAYLRSNPTNRDLRPLLGGKRVALVQPWGGHQSSFLQFQTSTGLTALIESGLRVLIENANPTRPCPVQVPNPPAVILAAHSGGGFALLAAAKSSSVYLPLVEQVWALDCMYWGEGRQWIDWGRANAGKRLRVRASTHQWSRKPRAEAEKIRAAALQNADVDVVNLAHDAFPRTFIPAFL
ncbi:MAG TPA: hypothetical protein PK880_12630 [Candidatus Competibacter sp.]|nr:hypothetical protein [Candidatus Competibacteraceae bacterium]HRC73359.1 hypothetical protein [Candidatus Competibacter sp.]